ncbi:hypothetical protein JHK86_001529 [Glycine max]|nr:hypothetical protein JHK86_001529 [Glycine max]
MNHTTIVIKLFDSSLPVPKHKDENASFSSFFSSFINILLWLLPSPSTFALALGGTFFFRLVPWGNARIAPDGTVVCQVQHFRFVRCLERLILEGRHNQWVNCFQMTGLGTSPIDCYTNGNGKAIDQKYAKETAQLNPPHRFVPWVVVNNQALQEDYQNFVTYICRAYKGNVIPNACRSLSTRTNDSNEKVNSFLPVCYVDEARNLTLPLVITRLLNAHDLPWTVDV